MKFVQKISIGVLCALSLLATGCNSDEELEPLSRDYESLMGEVQSLGGVRVNKLVSHLFEDEDGEIYYAFSDRYDLGDPDYFGVPVEAYGVVMQYDEADFDKPVFEIRRLSEAELTEEEVEEAELLTYKNSDLGVSFVYSDAWSLSELKDAVTLTAPLPEMEEGSESVDEEESSEDVEPDYVVLSRMAAGLERTSDDDSADRASEIRAYVRTNYSYLFGVESDLAYVGVDSQFAVRYKTETGDVIYFIPRGSDLVELAFYHPSPINKIASANGFSELVSSFRFMPDGADDESEPEEEDAEEEAPVEEEEEPEEEPLEEEPAAEPEVETDPGPSLSFEAYREFESNPYKFKMSYPKPWYYSGGSGGYDFSDEPIEDDTEVLIRLDLKDSGVVGTVTSGQSMTVTVEVKGRYYVLSGDQSFKEVLQAMAESIESTATE